MLLKLRISGETEVKLFTYIRVILKGKLRGDPLIENLRL